MRVVNWVNLAKAEVVEHDFYLVRTDEGHVLVGISLHVVD